MHCGVDIRKDDVTAVVANIGADTGYLTRSMAPAVLPGGKVLAVDVQSDTI